MRLKTRIKREVRFLRRLHRTLSRVNSISNGSPNLSVDDFEEAVDKHRDRPAIIFEGVTWTYADLDHAANRFAHWAKDQNIRRGQTVALVMPNRIEYVAIWLGLAKVGVITALINNQLTGPALAHCLTICKAAHILADEETIDAVEAVKDGLNHPAIWTYGQVKGQQKSLANALRSASSLRPDRALRAGMTAKDSALYIFTSGTTGLPKAARISHARVQLYMRGFAGSTGSVESDRIYLTLPLYHATGGLCGVGAALMNGGVILLSRRFHASTFWKEIREQDATMFVYIGELCRYLVNQAPGPEDRDHKLRLIFGNGLRADVWQEMIDRFGVPDVLEFYGSTEGNVSLFNFDGKVGAVARIPKYLRGRFNVRIVKFDVETEEPVRGPDGLCIETATGEVGECIGKIGGGNARFDYTGYADKAASEKKIMRDVFAKGDAYFRTGDLMRRDSEQFLYFVDRIGDTFRWKGENVATSEVAAALTAFEGVKEANVYGVKVPHAEGRAGMALLVVDKTFDIAKLSDHVDRTLPAYARPLFIRLAKEIVVTGTFKQRKVELVEAGYDPGLTKAPTYFRSPGKGFVKVTKTTLDKLASGTYRL